MNNWIFIRGLTRGTIHWGKFPEIFKLSHPDSDIEFLEIPGNGLLFMDTTPMNPEAVISYLLSQSRFVKEGKKFNICGISLGGMIALKWAELYPEQVLSVTVINSSLSQTSHFYERLIPKNYLKILQTLFSSKLFKQEKVVLAITSNKTENLDIYLESFSNFAKNHPVSKMSFIRQLILANNITISKIKCNLKVITAQHDRLVSFKCSKKLADLLKAELIIHPTAGHDLPLDEPEWLAKQL